MTNFTNSVTQPLSRSHLRRRLGRFYYRMKRRARWVVSSGKYASEIRNSYFDHQIIAHQSFLLRPLKAVDMYLQYNKITNLNLAIGKLDGLIIKPGEVFSIWYLVGNPTKRRGYLPGLVLNQGAIEEGVGGGLCQLGNLLCWMSLHTPLKIEERYRHGFDVFPDINRKIPFGSGATLAFNYIDFQLKNTTSNTFQIKLYLTDEHLKGEILCEKPLDERYEVYEDNHHFVQQAWGGYTRHNQIKRKVIHADQITEELIFENHAIMMYEPFLTP